MPKTDDPLLGAPLLNAGDVIAQIQWATEVLHSKQIIHGNVYAHNVMMNDAGHAILADLGASLYVTELIDFEEFRTIEKQAFGVFQTNMRTHFSQPDANGCDIYVDVDADFSSCAEHLAKKPKIIIESEECI